MKRKEVRKKKERKEKLMLRMRGVGKRLWRTQGCYGERKINDIVSISIDSYR